MRIAFTGPYADVNFGDYAMLVNNIAALGDHEYTVFSYDSCFLSRLLTDYFPDLRVSVEGVEVLPSPGLQPSSRAITGEECIRLLKGAQRLRDVLSGVDVLVVNGGGYLNDLWLRPHRVQRLLAILGPALLAQEMGKRVVFTASGLGPCRRTLDTYANLLAEMRGSVMHIRDEVYSPMWAARLGLPAERVFSAPDDLVIVANRLATQAGKEPPQVEGRYVVAETYAPLESLAGELGLWETFRKEMRKRYDCEVVILPLNVGLGGMDQARLLNDRLGMPYVDITERGYLPLETAVEVISGADLVVTGRYHALLLALTQSTPVLSVLREVEGDFSYYYSKNAGIVRYLRHGTGGPLGDYLDFSYSEAFGRAVDDFTGITDRQATDAREVPPRHMVRVENARHALLGRIIGE